MYKHKIKITKGLWDAYKAFKTKYPETELCRKEYINTCYLINQKISDRMVKDSLQFKIPFRLGTLSITKNKMKIKIKDNKVQTNKLKVDYGATWKYWAEIYPDLTREEIKQIPNKTVIYYTNDHTNGYIMKWRWIKRGANVINLKVYSFKPTKFNRLNLAKHIKSEDRENDYYLQT